MRGPVEVAELPDGSITVRNFRRPSGPALIDTRAEITAFSSEMKNGEFDGLHRRPGGRVGLYPIVTNGVLTMR
jgi:Domain of unknown function (DUF397)